jgi:hypothetical protein
VIRRPPRIVLIAAGVLVFLALSFELARWLTLENVERTDILDLLSAEARGDAASMLTQLHACTPACRAHVRTDARVLKRPGTVLILADSSATAYTLTGAVGFTRIAWKVTGRLPVVQCVTVSRTGNAITGLDVRLLRVSLEIPSTSDC